MSTKKREDGNGLYGTFKNLFLITTEEDVQKPRKGEPPENDFTMEGDDSDEPLYRGSGGGTDSESIDPGVRPPSWFDRMEEKTKQNEQRGRENSRLLFQIDYRTVWIARLLLGILTTVLAGLAMQLI